MKHTMACIIDNKPNSLLKEKGNVGMVLFEVLKHVRATEDIELRPVGSTPIR